jgi:hypothetical protein
MESQVLHLQGSAGADHCEMALKAAGLLTSLGAVRDTTFFSNRTVAIRFEVDASRVSELQQRLVATGVRLDDASLQALEHEQAANARVNVAGLLEIRFPRAAHPAR